MIRRRTRSRFAFPPDRSDASNSNVCDSNHTSNNSIRDFSTRTIARKLKAESTVDNSQDDQNAPEPHMDVSKKGSATELLVLQMMEQSSERLDEEEHEHDGAENAVGILEELCNRSARMR